MSISIEDSNYKIKYLKYKKKYLELSGGKLSIFNSNKTEQTASYIYTIDANGIIYLAVCRKVQRGARYRINGPNTGAAGTDEKYWGKWGSFGGGIDKSAKNSLAGAISEINHEGNISAVIGRFWKTDEIYITWSGKGKYNKNTPKLIYADNPKNDNILSIFLFKIDNPAIFFKLFPKLTENIRKGADIVTTSQGEIDANASVSINDIITFQKNEIKNKKNNMFLSYYCDTFNKIIKNEILKNENINKYKNNMASIPFINDVKERIPTEFPANKNEYVEGPIRRYKNQKYYLLGLFGYLE